MPDWRKILAYSLQSKRRKRFMHFLFHGRTMDSTIGRRLTSLLRQCSDFVITIVCRRTLLWISIPTPAHQLFPSVGRLLATFFSFWTVAFIHPFEEQCRSALEFSERLPPVPHLPQHYAKAVYVCFPVIHLGMKYLRCDVHRAPRQSTRDVIYFFRNSNVGYLD